MKVKVYNFNWNNTKPLYTGKLHQWSSNGATGIIEKPDGFFEAVPTCDIQVVSVEDQIDDLEKEIKRLSMINNIPLSEEERVKIDKEYSVQQDCS